MAPIHWASTKGNVDVVRLLLQRGVCINSCDIKQTTPLAIAAQYDQTVLVFFLVRSRADINVLDYCQDSALHWAAYKGNQQTVALLHYLGLPADAADGYGSTPLHLATAQGATSVVDYFIETCDAQTLLALKDNKGRTVADVARERGHRHLLRTIAAIQPPLWQRILQGVTGKGGEKFFFVFFWINSIGTIISYLVFLAPNVGSLIQTCVFCGATLLMYLFYLMTYLSDPGYVPTSGHPHQMYRQALELAADGFVEQAEAIGSLCHTCRIARPLRSKHCSVSKRCVSTFDHHCPYVNNTIGSNNYKTFIAFMFFGLVSITTALLGNIQYVLYVRWHPWVIFQLIDQACFDCFAWVMNGFHASLISRNLTTNEHMNVMRYIYLRDDLGRYRNAFDQGTLANIRDWWSRRENVEANPYVYTDRFKQFLESEHAPQDDVPPGSPSGASTSMLQISPLLSEEGAV